MSDVLIAIAGRKGHGKDTAASGLPDDFVNVKFAGPIKVMLDALLEYAGVDADKRHRMVEGDLKEVPTSILCGKTPRYVMQTLGTEWGRNLIGEEFWTTIFGRRIKQFDKVVCTDMRFPNEVGYVHALNGITVRVERPGAAKTGGDEHPSETSIDTLPVDYVIQNDGTIADLALKLNGILIEEFKT
jgi:hypothetical protein